MDYYTHFSEYIEYIEALTPQQVSESLTRAEIYNEIEEQKQNNNIWE